MDGCTLPGGFNMEEVLVKSTIARMLSDNYTLIIVFFIAGSIISLVLFYFAKQLYQSLKEYRQNSKQSGYGGNDENEQYDDPENEYNDPKQHEEPKKKMFYKGIDDVYKEYNVEKSSYIKSSYKKDNDDFIDSKIAYQRHDEYNYSDSEPK